MPHSKLVLVLETNSADAVTLEAAFKEYGVCNPTRVLRNDSELRSYVAGAGVYGNRELFPVPGVLLLDFSQPMVALNLLEWLRSRHLDAFPIIGVGTRNSKALLQCGFDRGLNGYFEKGTDLYNLARTICELRWLDDGDMRWSDAADVQLLTKEQFYRKGAA